MTIERLPWILRLRRSAASRDDARRRQRTFLRHVVRHAAKNVPIHQKRFRAAGIDPDAVGDLDDLTDLEPTDKADYQQGPLDHVVARGLVADRLHKRTTSGSSGEPMSIYRSPIDQQLLAALWRRAMGGFGIGLRDRVMSMRFHGAPPAGPILTSLRRVGLSHDVSVSVLEAPEQLVDRIIEAKPDVIIGYPGILSEIVANRDLSEIGVRLIVCGAEVLTPPTRSLIAKGFGGAKVVELYGSHEFQLIASQCPVGDALHLCDDGVAVEILRDGKHATKGESGELVATALHSHAMPFIRHRLRDVVVRGDDECPCGAPYSTLSVVCGREIDYLHFGGERLVHPYTVFPTIQSADWVRRFQLVQRRLDEVTLRAVTTRAPSDDEITALERAVARDLGAGASVRVKLEHTIDAEANGKFRIVQSDLTTHVPSDAGT